VKNKSIYIAGIEITKEQFPHLFCIAEKNPDGLQDRLIEIDRASGGESNIMSVAINLENDLQHG
jgi:hypothetical protein